jgi:hypothetical protein
MSKPMIHSFMTAFHQYKKDANLPAGDAIDDKDVIFDRIREEFVDVYLENELNTREKIMQIIDEYGWRKMINERFNDVLESDCEQQLSGFLQDPVKNNSMVTCMLFDMCYDDMYK